MDINFENKLPKDKKFNLLNSLLFKNLIHQKLIKFFFYISMKTYINLYNL